MSTLARTNFYIEVILLSLFIFKLNTTAGNNILKLQENDYVLSHFSSQNPLPGQSIQCIYEDSKGLLWIGIESIGVSKYNGKRHVVYSNKKNDSKSLSNNYPTKIIEDDLGYIWVATSNGLNRLNRSTENFKQFFKDNSNNSINNDVVSTLAKDEYGNIWIGTANGLNIYNPYRDEFCSLFYNDNADEPANLNYIHSIYISDDKNIWIGTAIHGLFNISGKIYKELAIRWQTESISDLTEIITQIENEKKYLKNNATGDIRDIKAHKNTLWLATQNGLFFIKNNVFYRIKFPEYDQDISTTPFYSILIDSENILWASTSNSGVVVIDLNHKIFTPKIISSENEDINNLRTNSVREIIESKSGLIWLATKFDGLYNYDRRQNTFSLLKEKDKDNNGLYDGFVTSIVEDKDKNLWIGTKNGGITKYNIELETFEYFIKSNKQTSLNSNRIEAMLIDNRDRIWIGTDKGLSKKEHNKNEFENFLNFHVRYLYDISDEYLWIGTEYGLFRFSKLENKIIPLQTKHTDFFDRKNNISIKSIVADKDSVYWIATGTSGLFEYHAKTDDLYNYLHDPNHHESLCGNAVRALHIDKEGDLWIGTKSSGLCKFKRDKESFIIKSNSAHLPSNTIYHILEDNNGILWLGTHEGISSYNKQTDEYNNYSTVHGLQSSVFETNAHLKTSDGKLLMGGNKGLNIFNPNNIKTKPSNSNLIISYFNIFNIPKSIDITEKQHFKLDSKSNYISFEFALLDYSKPEENKYRYKLEPFDNDWIESGTRNFASYTNLMPGEYTFKAQGISNIGSNNLGSTEVQFTIETALWKRKWFVILVTLFVVSAVFFVYRLKIISANKREGELKKTVQKRTEDLYAAYQKLSNFNKEVEKQNKNLLQQRDQIAKQNLELEMHRTQLQSMVLERTKDLEAEKIKAQESDRLKSAFLANMSHEIRTPLNAILGFIDLLQNSDFDEKEKNEMNKIIHQNSNDLLQLINDIIDISIIEANQLVIKKVDIKINQYIKDLINVYCSGKNMINENVTLLIDIPDDSENLIIRTDPGRLKQIYINLINNAIKFTETGYIKYGYKIEKKKNRIKCFVEDTGMGISKENQKLLFKRFTKIEPTLEKVHRGTGLGLSISKHLSELLGGSIHLKSELGKGSIFYFYIPIK